MYGGLLHVTSGQPEQHTEIYNLTSGELVDSVDGASAYRIGANHWVHVKYGGYADAGVYLTKDGHQRQIISHPFYSMDFDMPVVPLDASRVLVGYDDQRWIVDALSGVASPFGAPCNPLGLTRDRDLVCYDPQSRRIDLISLDGTTRRHLQLPERLYAWGYSASLDALVAVRVTAGFSWRWRGFLYEKRTLSLVKMPDDWASGEIEIHALPEEIMPLGRVTVDE